MRAITALRLPDIERQPAPTAAPEIRWVDPASLRVDERYQRPLSEGSIRLLRKIVGHWDWRKFKPPICAETETGLDVIDGQHTAIGAVSRGIESIPVLVIVADEMAERAEAFVGHNRDRLALSQAAIYYAGLAAGDEDALTVQQVCERAGVRILRQPPGQGNFLPGDTMAVVLVRSLVGKRGAMGARIVLQAIREARETPIRADTIRAVDALLNEPEYKGKVLAADITSALLRLGLKAHRDAELFAAGHGGRVWRGLVVTLAQEVRHGRRRAA